MRTIIANDRQNIIDLATQYYGSAAGVIDLCKDNGWELDHDVQPGDQVLLQDTYPESADADVADYLQGIGVVVVSISEQGAVAALGTNNNEFIITNDNNYLGA
jgi:hypothetical protein